MPGKDPEIIRFLETFLSRIYKSSIEKRGNRMIHQQCQATVPDWKSHKLMGEGTMSCVQ